MIGCWIGVLRVVSILCRQFFIGARRQLATANGGIQGECHSIMHLNLGWEPVSQSGHVAVREVGPHLDPCTVV